MGTIAPTKWKNYHRNLALDVEQVEPFAPDPHGGAKPDDGPAMLAASAAVLAPIVSQAISNDYGIGVLGSAWSLSDLIGMERFQLTTDLLSAMAMLRAEDMHCDSAIDPGTCALVGGGAKLCQLSDFAEARGLSLKTCGSYLGQSVAGSVATSINGSALGYGGFQNQIRGLHFIAGDNRSVWVERESDPALSNDAAQVFASEVIRDDAIFDGCLVHLGGMGIVNAVAFQLVPRAHYAAIRKRQPVDQTWLDSIGCGDFKAIARRLGHDEQPAYYEVQIDPFDCFGSSALHTLYFRLECPDPDAGPVEVYRSLDGITAAFVEAQRATKLESNAGGPPLPSDVFAYYSLKYFVETNGDEPEGASTWGQLHAKPPPAELQGVIYTSAFALDRDGFAEALARCCAAVQASLQQPDAKRHLLYTLRFVSGASGSMAFTKYDETVVIDMEGLMPSPWSKLQAEATVSALCAEPAISFCPHWGKLQAPTAALIEREFGPSCDPESAVGRWRQARNAIVSAKAQDVIWNKALRNWGLVK